MALARSRWITLSATSAGAGGGGGVGAGDVGAGAGDTGAGIVSTGLSAVASAEAGVIGSGAGAAGVSIGASTGIVGASTAGGIGLVFISSVIKILNKEFFERPPRAKKTPWYSTLLKELKIKFSFLIFPCQKQIKNY